MVLMLVLKAVKWTTYIYLVDMKNYLPRSGSTWVFRLGSFVSDGFVIGRFEVVGGFSMTNFSGFASCLMKVWTALSMGGISSGSMGFPECALLRLKLISLLIKVQNESSRIRNYKVRQCYKCSVESPSFSHISWGFCLLLCRWVHWDPRFDQGCLKIIKIV